MSMMWLSCSWSGSGKHNIPGAGSTGKSSSRNNGLAAELCTKGKGSHLSSLGLSGEPLPIN